MKECRKSCLEWQDEIDGLKNALLWSDELACKNADARNLAQAEVEKLKAEIAEYRLRSEIWDGKVRDMTLALERMADYDNLDLFGYVACKAAREALGMRWGE